VSKAQNQRPNGGMPDPSGGNSTGGTTLKAPKLHQPPAFMGKSGTPDNQSTSRGKGST